jgi:hypothetical protein
MRGRPENSYDSWKEAVATYIHNFDGEVAATANLLTAVPGRIQGLRRRAVRDTASSAKDLDPPDAAFQAGLDAVFARSQASVVRFAHPLQDREAACTVFVAQTAPAG